MEEAHMNCSIILFCVYPILRSRIASCGAATPITIIKVTFGNESLAMLSTYSMIKELMNEHL